MQQLLIALFLLASYEVSAQTVAIFDSGVDYRHSYISDYIYTNSKEVLNGIDDDGNGYIDDISGWNFIDDSNQTFFPEREDQFGDELYKYYRVRAKRSKNISTPEDDIWYKEKRADKTFMSLRKKFGSFVHGTHVTSLALGLNHLPAELSPREISFLDIKFLGKKKSAALFEDYIPIKTDKKSIAIDHIKSYLEAYALESIDKLTRSINFVNKRARVINGSFGISFSKGQDYARSLYKKQFKVEAKKEDVNQLAHYYLDILLSEGKKVITKNSTYLFIFSAGNKKNDNDIRPHYPSSIKADNIITVAASYEDDKAYFSNFGKESVDLFAPGLAVNGAVPGEEFLPVNGTSQAAPQVAAVANHIFLMANHTKKKVSALFVKKIITESLNVKSSLSQYSKYSGIINPEDAYELTRLKLSN